MSDPTKVSYSLFSSSLDGHEVYFCDHSVGYLAASVVRDTVFLCEVKDPADVEDFDSYFFQSATYTISDADTVGSAIASPQKIIKSVPISVSNSGDNVIVTAVPGKRIKVIAYCIQSYGTVTAKWKSGTGNDLSGYFTFGQREGNSMATPLPTWMFGTAAGESLNLNLSSNVQVAGFVTYFDNDRD